LTSNTSVSASFATSARSASFATSARSASYAPTPIVPIIKAGLVSGSLFTGKPRKYTVTFSTSFPTTNYTVTISGPARTWTAENLSTSGFLINSNANHGFSELIHWQAIQVGEF
jgi:hypothetical protein